VRWRKVVATHAALWQFSTARAFDLSSNMSLMASPLLSHCFLGIRDSAFVPAADAVLRLGLTQPASGLRLTDDYTTSFFESLYQVYRSETPDVPDHLIGSGELAFVASREQYRSWPQLLDFALTTAGKARAVGHDGEQVQVRLSYRDEFSGRTLDDIDQQVPWPRESQLPFPISISSAFLQIPFEALPGYDGMEWTANELRIGRTLGENEELGEVRAVLAIDVTVS
jgi:hypothetical protein